MIRPKLKKLLRLVLPSLAVVFLYLIMLSLPWRVVAAVYLGTAGICLLLAFVRWKLVFPSQPKEHGVALATRLVSPSGALQRCRIVLREDEVLVTSSQFPTLHVSLNQLVCLVEDGGFTIEFDNIELTFRESGAKAKALVRLISETQDSWYKQQDLKESECEQHV